jgi:hypothetical protein
MLGSTIDQIKCRNIYAKWTSLTANLRLTNVHNPMCGDRARIDFEREVLANVSHQIEDLVQTIID